jgi:predicted RNase H-like nuclease/ppGpp synthetase/RelA/SpoT-type nucleotidyltranferase
MHFIGVDLAWADRRPTGIAVLDEGGRLLDLAAHVSDDDVVAALRPHVTDACLVAFDAPLVVVNPTGNRPCEAALNADFARFDAGAHPSNTSKPEFADSPRGARLAAILGLDIDPSSVGPRRAIEVYPHPATVALFRLGRTLKYKHKQGRDLPQLQGELLRLVGLLEGLAASEVPLELVGHDGWDALVAGIRGARRKSELRRAEDQVDAVVCAYVAMFAERRPAATRLYGDLATGYIVTPALPEGLSATPRDDTGNDTGRVRRAVQRYAEMQPGLREATDGAVDLMTALLDDAGINYLSVTGRTKSVTSFAAKAARLTGDDQPMFPDPVQNITDQIGVRIITYLRGDVDAVADLLGEHLPVLDDRDMGQETASEGRFGYSSRHLMVAVGEHRVQVQVRTVLQHAWAEFEHATRYKGEVPAEHVPDLDRRFTLAAGLLELADREFSLIHDRLQGAPADELPEADDTDPRISGPDLATFLGERYADAGWSRPDHYTWITGLLLELGIASLEELAGHLDAVDSAELNRRLGYGKPPTAVRRLDDALLFLFDGRYVALHGNAHRMELLRTRLEKLRSDGG